MIAFLRKSQPLLRTVERACPFATPKRLPYLQAVIREGMRIFASQAPLLNKTVPESGDVLAGYKLPAGTQVGMDGWGILRSKEHWGSDAHTSSDLRGG